MKKNSAKALGRNPDRTSLSWWFEPISKIWVKMDHFPKISGWTWKNICLNHHLDQVDGSEIPNSQPPTWDGAFEPTLAAGFLNLLTLMVQKTTGFKPPIFFQMKRFWRVQTSGVRRFHSEFSMKINRHWMAWMLFEVMNKPKWPNFIPYIVGGHPPKKKHGF